MDPVSWDRNRLDVSTTGESSDFANYEVLRGGWNPDSAWTLDGGVVREGWARKSEPMKAVIISAPGTMGELDLPLAELRYVPFHPDTQVPTERPISFPVLVQPDLRPGHEPTWDMVHRESYNLESETEELD